MKTSTNANLRYSRVTLCATMVYVGALTAKAASISLETAPPVVVGTVPTAGATDVDAALRDLTVTFSKPMQDGSWSWSTWGEGSYPETTGEPHYQPDGRTCVLPVKLEPGRFYALWLNTDRFRNFKDRSGQPAVPYLLTFRTAAAGVVAHGTHSGATIERARGTADEARLEGRGSRDSRIIFRVGRSEWSCGFFDDTGFVATLAREGTSLRCVVKHSDGRLLLTTTMREAGRVKFDQGRIVFRDGTLARAPDGSYEVGHFASKSGAPLPITVQVGEQLNQFLPTEPDASEVIAQAVATISQCAEGDPRVTKAMTQLRRVPEAQLLSGLVPFLGDSKDTARRAAVYVVMQGGFTDLTPVVAPLKNLLTHPEDLTRGMAALALGQNRAAGSFEPLAKMAREDKSGYARRCAAYALGLLGDSRAEPVLTQALADPEAMVRNNAQAALAMLKPNAGVEASEATETMTERTVDKAVGDFPTGEDLSTPEGACAAWQRASARKEVEALARMSLVPLDLNEQRAWYERETRRDPEGLVLYLKAVADSRMVAVQIWRGELANVITHLPFPEGQGRQPYSARTFGLVKGQWRNLGEDRWPDLATAKAGFASRREQAWDYFIGLKNSSRPTRTTPSRPESTAFESIPQLNDDQRAVIAWTDRQFRSYFDQRTFDGWSAEEIVTLEKRLIDALSGPRDREYYQAISTLGALHSTNALPRLRQLAFERVDRNNRDRWMAVRVLGMLGDRQSIPDLIHLVYHGNQNTHWWAQIALAQLTGQNFGGDWEAWGRWWNESGGQPPYTGEIIRWWDGQAQTVEELKAVLAEGDAKFLADLK